MGLAARMVEALGALKLVNGVRAFLGEITPRVPVTRESVATGYLRPGNAGLPGWTSARGG